MTHQVFISSAIPVAPITSAKTFAEASASYLEHGGDGKHLDPIIEYFGNRPLASIYPFDVKEMATALYPTQSNATRNRQALTPARAVINHGYERGWCALIRIKKLKEDPPKRKNPASPVWMHSFIRQCAKDNLPHVAAIVLFMSQTAARVSEAINVRWRDVDLARPQSLAHEDQDRNQLDPSPDRRGGLSLARAARQCG